MSNKPHGSESLLSTLPTHAIPPLSFVPLLTHASLQPLTHPLHGFTHSFSHLFAPWFIPACLSQLPLYVLDIRATKTTGLITPKSNVFRDLRRGDLGASSWGRLGSHKSLHEELSQDAQAGFGWGAGGIRKCISSEGHSMSKGKETGQGGVYPGNR